MQEMVAELTLLKEKGKARHKKKILKAVSESLK